MATNASQRGNYSRGHSHPYGALTTRLEVAHFIPFALGSFRSNDSEAVEGDRHPTVWDNLIRYFPILHCMSFA
jgi:hypothetical protein